LSEGKDPKGRSYYWIFEQKIDKDIEADTDYAAVFAGHASITPLHLDPTDTESLTSLAHWAEKLARFAKSLKS
jgi:5'-nucleotidase